MNYPGKKVKFKYLENKPHLHNVIYEGYIILPIFPVFGYFYKNKFKWRPLCFTVLAYVPSIKELRRFNKGWINAEIEYAS